jgi:hypothetical protein
MVRLLATPQTAHPENLISHETAFAARETTTGVLLKPKRSDSHKCRWLPV